MPRVFLLSPANSEGKRAQMLLRDAAQFDLAQRIRRGGAPLGEVFSFLSGLYFRGKMTYASEFARPGNGTAGALVITPNRGLVPAETIVTIEDLRDFSTVPIDETDARYTEPLVRDARQLRESIGANGEVVLLGSIATRKYVDCLLPIFGERLLFPSEFVGRGDMSRGGLLLRGVSEGRELEYQPAAGAIRHGQRPPKLSRSAAKSDSRTRL